MPSVFAPLSAQVDGVTVDSPTYGLLTVVMTLLVVAFLLAWLIVVCVATMRNAASRRRMQSQQVEFLAVTPSKVRCVRTFAVVRH